MSKNGRNPHASISPAEAERAVYVDFEGFMNQSPSLLGVLVDGLLNQVVLDVRLTDAARAKGCKTRSLGDIATELKQLCARDDRRIVGYSQHEREVFLNYAGVDFDSEYRDARMIAKRWWSICRPGILRPDNSLKTFVEAIGQPMPVYFGERKVTSRLRAVIDMLGRRSTYDELTPVVKAKWQKLLDYNAYDCRGMRDLVTIASTQIQASRK